MPEKKYLYEILIRGTANGEISGAHQIWSTAFTDDVGNVVFNKDGVAEVLNVDDVGALLTSEFAGAVRQISELHGTLRMEREQSTQAIADLQTEVADLTALVQRLNAALTTANLAAAEAQAARQGSKTE